MCSLQNKCVPYWPTTQGETKEAGRYLVTLLSEKDANDYKVRVIELSAPHRVRKVFLIPNVSADLIVECNAAKIMGLIPKA